MTGNVDIKRLVYKIERARKVYDVYQLIEQAGTNHLTDLIRIEDFRGFSKGRDFDRYMRIRNVNNWSKCQLVTGLRKTRQNNIFFGDHNRKGMKNLIIFIFNPDFSRLIIHYYNGFYPKNAGDLERFIYSKYILSK